METYTVQLAKGIRIKKCIWIRVCYETIVTIFMPFCFGSCSLPHSHLKFKKKNPKNSEKFWSSIVFLIFETSSDCAYLSSLEAYTGVFEKENYLAFDWWKHFIIM